MAKLPSIVWSTEFKMKFYLLLVLAMLAFAANSIFCRMALAGGHIDAASFTSIRLLSGAVMLAIILFYCHGGLGREKLNPLSALMLFIYAICFSFSYVEVTAATGALILFPAVHFSLIVYGLVKGERPTSIAWLGIACALAGLFFLLLPGASAPPLFSALLMVVAGVAVLRHIHCLLQAGILVARYRWCWLLSWCFMIMHSPVSVE